MEQLKARGSYVRAFTRFLKLLNRSHCIRAFFAQLVPWRLMSAFFLKLRQQTGALSQAICFNWHSQPLTSPLLLSVDCFASQCRLIPLTRFHCGTSVASSTQIVDGPQTLQNTVVYDENCVSTVIVHPGLSKNCKCVSSICAAWLSVLSISRPRLLFLVLILNLKSVLLVPVGVFHLRMLSLLKDWVY